MTSMVNLSWLPPIVRAGFRAAGRQPQRACRRRHRLAGGDRAQPLGQDRVHYQPDPQSAQLAAQSQPDAAAQRGRRAPPVRRASRGSEGGPAAAVSLSRQYPEDGRSGLAGAHRRSQRDRHRSALRARQRGGQAAERDHRQPRQLDHPDRRLSRRMVARSPAAGAKLCRLVARDVAVVAQGRPRRDQRRVSRLSRAASGRGRRQRRGGEAGA